MRDLLLSCVSLVLLSLPVWAQNVELLHCAQINFFAPACEPVQEVASSPSPPPSLQPEYPLFSPETLAPDTPPLMIKLLEDPTRENALAFLAWQAKRQERIADVQELLHALTRAGGKGK